MDIDKRNDIYTTILQQILSDRLLLVVGLKKNLSAKFKFKSIITNHP